MLFRLVHTFWRLQTELPEAAMSSLLGVLVASWAGFTFSGFPHVTSLVNGPDCVSVLLEPPRGCPVPLLCLAGVPWSSQTYWPILPAALCDSTCSYCVSLQLLPNSLSRTVPLKIKQKTFELKRPTTNYFSAWYTHNIISPQFIFKILNMQQLYVSLALAALSVCGVATIKVII